MSTSITKTGILIADGVCKQESSEIGFDEASFEDNARIASGYMQAREFYED